MVKGITGSVADMLQANEELLPACSDLQGTYRVLLSFVLLNWCRLVGGGGLKSLIWADKMIGKKRSSELRR